MKMTWPCLIAFVMLSSIPKLNAEQTTYYENTTVAAEVQSILERLDVPANAYSEGNRTVCSPITGEVIGNVADTDETAIDQAIGEAHEAFLAWRKLPAPKRGELVRLFGEELRAAKNDLGRLVTLENGKILSEGLGEVQEMIDICDYAVGLSRQLYGLTISTERKGHRMQEAWHPAGVVGVISAFNFPVAVWAWNAMLAFVCGDSVVWKPSEKTPLTALAVQSLFQRAAARFGGVPTGLSTVILGDRRAGEQLVNDPRVPVVSATGSTAMGHAVAPLLAQRFARAILELGGNNGCIITPSADLDLALRAVAFASMGTAGQRCTTLRRLFVHESVYDAFVPRLKKVFDSVNVGDPRKEGILIGPLVDERAYESMQLALQEAQAEGAQVNGGDRVAVYPEGFYVRPALVEINYQSPVVKRETFAPILYVMKYSSYEEALALHNDVAQGLSSSIFTTDLLEAEHFLSAEGSDCGIANVNIGTSGAEIGGAFGGEKETGGGRESGSDSWKAYMRRATNTINYSHDLPLAQGVEFDID